MSTCGGEPFSIAAIVRGTTVVEELRRLRQHTDDLVRLADHRVRHGPGTARTARIRRHLAQALGAFPREALHLLRIAVIRHGPDEQVARTDDARAADDHTQV